MNEAIYDQVNNRYQFFLITYKAILTGDIPDPETIKKYDGYDPFDHLKIAFELDQLEKEFPDKYIQYLEKFLVEYFDLASLFLNNVTRNDKIEKTPYNDAISACLDFLIFEINDRLKPKQTIQVQPQKDVKPLKGESVLNREQTALFFWFLREMRLIRKPTNGNLAKAIEILTGYSAKQMQDIIKSPGTEVKFLGKDNNGLKREDFKGLILALEKLTERVKKDYRTNSENNELR